MAKAPIKTRTDLANCVSAVWLFVVSAGYCMKHGPTATRTNLANIAEVADSVATGVDDRVGPLYKDYQSGR